MKIATILPTPHLTLEKESDYHMCLAHLMGDEKYADFFAKRARRSFVLMDNGSVEVGHPMSARDLFFIAKRFGVTQVCLPDMIRDADKTLGLHAEASVVAQTITGISLMAIPQGSTKKQWVSCAESLLRMSDAWGIDAIGISRFQYGIWEDRAEAILAVPDLVDSDLDIHLLGCWGSDPTEAYATASQLPEGRIRGTDSGIAAIFTQAGLRLMHDQRPKIDLDFSRYYDTAQMRSLLLRNVDRYKRAVTEGR